ncbi:MAG: tRNA epoxyqueuosine(34) reductase QueG [Gammaproteobacteria bacterium]|nr:tRNA epoxyqueuosine(34) reductase QueG [Gammaproteobacteria bacterium]
MSSKPNSSSPQELVQHIQEWAQQLGFNHVGIADTNLDEHEAYLLRWLDKGHHGDMGYMAKHGQMRSKPNQLLPGTLRIISVRMDYYPPRTRDPIAVLEDSDLAYISRYTLGRDYHKVLRKRLQKLADKIQDEVGEFGYRAFVDSAPVLEKPLAEKAGLGWIGKHTNLISHDAGSWFFLGELFTDLPLPLSSKVENACGSCQACIDICPTQAIIAPYELDARRCISYLTIENKGSIAEEFRQAIGNRIYGCDDCQLACPWNSFAQTSELADFAARQQLDSSRLVDLFAWSEEEFLKNTEGSAMRRIGHEQWLRNIAVALGNAVSSDEVIQALQARLDYPSAMVQEHISWAIAQHQTSSLQC